jgi:SAM-dependent methyltransferase
MANTAYAVPDQRLFWDQWHQTHTSAGQGNHCENALMFFIENLPAGVGGRILEVGCGQGREAIHLARLGYEVSAFDRSQVAIKAARLNAVKAGIPVDFAKHDMTQELPYDSHAFLGIFSHLSLHYYDNYHTHRIFDELARVISPGGTLFFTARSVLDPFYGQGEKIGQDLFCHEGHVRRFFGESYIRDELAAWDIRIAEYYQIEGDRKANPGIYLRVLARRL